MSDSYRRTTVTRAVFSTPTGDDRQACLIWIYPSGGDLGRRFDLLESPLVLGRSVDAHIVVASDHASRRHARLEQRGEEWAVVDMQSKNGTYVNGTRIDEQVLEDGDLVVIGDAILKYLTARNVEMAYHRELYRLTIVNSHTRAYNRRYLLEQLDRELARCERSGHPLSLILFDLDNFKLVNDTYGHLAGDRVLAEVAGRVLRRIRKTDLFARYGGEEFALLLPNTTQEQAVNLGEQLRLLVEKRGIWHGPHVILVTMSGGVATTNREQSREELIERADVALREAKSKGRNLITAQPDPPGAE